MLATETLSSKERALRFAAMLEREFQRWCDDGDMQGYRNRNGMIWSAIRAAGPQVEALVQKELDRVD